MAAEGTFQLISDIRSNPLYWKTFNTAGGVWREDIGLDEARDEDWAPMLIFPGSIVRAPDNDPIKSRTIDAMAMAAWEELGEGGEGFDAIVGVEDDEPWAQSLIDIGFNDGTHSLVSENPAKGDLPAGSRALLVADVLTDGIKEISAVEEIREERGAEVTGVVAVADMLRGAKDHIARETGLVAVRSVMSVIDVYVTLKAMNQITEGSFAFAMRWAQNPHAAIPPDQRVRYHRPDLGSY